MRIETYPSFSLLKIALALIPLLLLAGAFASGLHEHLSLQSIQTHFGELRAYHKQNPVTAMVLYILMFFVLAAMSMPGIIAYTILGGALFGFTTGLVIVSFSGGLAATLFFLLVRYLFHDWVNTRYEKQLRRIQEGFRKDGIYYFIAMRMSPVLPYSLVNILMALTPMRALTFWIVGQLGMLPGNIVYVYMGQELASIRSVRDIFSPEMLIAFTLVGFLPLITRKAVQWMESHKAR